MRVPFLDLRPSHAPIRDALLEDVAGVLDSSAFVNGAAVGAFEDAFAGWCARAHCVGVSSGLDALRLALLAAGIGRGDEVILPAFTFVATAEAVSQAGATPVLVDVGEDANIDPAAAAAAAGERTRAILAVHLYGQLADVRALAELADRRGIELHEDAAQSHGAARDGVVSGQLGRVASFSFYPGKNLGAIGDAGAVATDDAGLAEAVRVLREHGQRRKYEHDEIGFTARLDTIQAAALLRKLPFLREWNEQRRVVARLYGEALEGVGDLRLPLVAERSEPVWHLYAVRTADPAALAAHLAAQGIGSGRHYPVPVHLTKAYAALGHRAGEFPRAEAWAREELSLPIFPGMTPAQVECVVDAVRGYFAGSRAAA